MHGTEQMIEDYYKMRSRVDELERKNAELSQENSNWKFSANSKALRELQAAYQTVNKMLSETSRELAILRLEHAEIESTSTQSVMRENDKLLAKVADLEAKLKCAG